MSINVNDKNLGHATAYAYYKAGGGTMTEAEFTEFMADFGTASQTAVEAAQAALASKNAAQTAATTATSKATEATTAATTATTKAGEASTSASTATSAKDTAVSASQTATSKATEATTAAATATSAKTDAVAANTAAQSAKTAAQTAQTGAETAAASVQSSAAQIATNAEDISQLKSEITDKSDTADMLKAFPTDTASGSVASFADGANVPVKSLIVNIDPVQSGSGDPSPDNVRPISGWTGANVARSGVNVWDEEWEQGKISENGNNVADSSRIRAKNLFFVKPGGTYYIVGTRISWVEYDKERNFMRLGNNGSFVGTNESFTVSNDAYYIRFFTTTLYGGTYNHDISINYPATDNDYHPYAGNLYPITFPSEAGTVYGGELDVTNGVLTVDMAMVDLGTQTWNYDTDWASQPHFWCNATQIKRTNSGDIPKMVCSNYKTVSASDLYMGVDMACTTNSARIRIRDTSYTDAAAFKTAMDGVQLVYELAEPIVYTLTPTEIKSLLGDNNVWADSGDSTVEYRADPTLYIGRLTEPDADMVADSNIVSGQYFMVGNTLYKATANIASGATISPNVNCTRKSLSEALNELNV